MYSPDVLHINILDIANPPKKLWNKVNELFITELKIDGSQITHATSVLNTYFPNAQLIYIKKISGLSHNDIQQFIHHMDNYFTENCVFRHVVSNLQYRPLQFIRHTNSELPKNRIALYFDTDESICWIPIDD